MGKRLIFLDLDGTIIGNVTPLVNEWYMIKKYNNTVKSKEKFKEKVRVCLREWLLRPHFKYFIDYYKDDDIYVYTASRYYWAKIVVTCIEDVIGKKFVKQIFARKYCLKTNKKRMSMVLRDIGFNGVNESPSIILVDNNYVLNDDESRYLLKAPSYTAIVMQDILENIPSRIISKSYLKIKTDLQSCNMYPYTLRYQSMQEPNEESFYATYYNYLNYVKQYDEVDREDVFWRDIVKEIKNKR